MDLMTYILVKDAETGQRGTHHRGGKHTWPISGHRELVDQKLKELRALTTDNPIQQTRLTTRSPGWNQICHGSNTSLKFGKCKRIRAGIAGSSYRKRQERNGLHTKLIVRWQKRDQTIVKRSVEEKERRNVRNYRRRRVPCAHLFSGVVGYVLTRNIAVPLGQFPRRQRRSPPVIWPSSLFQQSADGWESWPLLLRR